MRIIQDRRALHRIPELELALPKTMEYLRNRLTGLKCALLYPTPESLCAFFDFGSDHAIAFRADCDALPIRERSGADYASQHPGCMHACGHDGHMAVLLELARRLSEKKSLPHNVLLIFQPGEETPAEPGPSAKAAFLQSIMCRPFLVYISGPDWRRGLYSAGRTS